MAAPQGRQAKELHRMSPMPDGTEHWRHTGTKKPSVEERGRA